MTRDDANDVLTLWKHGLAKFPEKTISRALAATGDLVPCSALQASERAAVRRACQRVEGTIRVWRSSVAAGNSKGAAA